MMSPTQSCNTPKVPSRRERLRAETTEAIKTAALHQIEQEGAARLSLRAVSREIGMSVAGLYRYYESRDALLTVLIAEAFADLAGAVEAGTSVEGDVKKQLLGGARGYRKWSLENPNRFALVFGTPVPGYSAPEDGPTVEAVFSLGVAWGAPVRAGINDATLDARGWDETGLVDAELVRQMGVDSSAEAIRVVAAWWAYVHGLVVLEMQNHFGWAIADLEAFFVEELERWLTQL